MSVIDYLYIPIPVAKTAALALRLVLAAGCGACLGIERSKRFKAAGIRTHILVCCAAALFMILSKYSFVDLADAAGNPLYGTRGADPARIAAQVVSGISFLGAGIIYRKENSVKGLTTAAGVWATAGIGLSIGSGMIALGLITTVLIMIFQYFTHRFTIGGDSYDTNNLEFVVREEDSNGFYRVLESFADELNAQIIDVAIDRREKMGVRYKASLKMKRYLTMEELARFSNDHPEIISVSNAPM